MLWRASELAGAEKASHANCEPTHPSGGSGLVVAMHGRMGKGLRAAVAKWMFTDCVAFICLYIATWLAVSVVLVLD